MGKSDPNPWPASLLFLFVFFSFFMRIHGGRPIGTSNSAPAPVPLPRTIHGELMGNEGSFVALSKRGGGRGGSKNIPLIVVGAGAGAGTGAVLGKSKSAAPAVSSSSYFATALVMSALGSAILACI